MQSHRSFPAHTIAPSLLLWILINHTHHTQHRIAPVGVIQLHDVKRPALRNAGGLTLISRCMSPTMFEHNVSSLTKASLHLRLAMTLGDNNRNSLVNTYKPLHKEG